MQSKIIEIVERDGDVLELRVQTAAGSCTVIATIAKLDNLLVLDHVHVEGEGLTRALIRQAARELGRREQATTVWIQGGKRSSGAKPGSSPNMIVVEVGE